ncbi:inositol-tetrakisphosphate 1-kinase-like [Onthophagus taurus]|uniref:inositol-tetrakisphosphate 1-kinase-like n=1 Tax=Onthophagus taurus TaxID=166361 RepID=UPI000C20C492|nr:inositol-tetrakisphosphate 1-kinase-like [Onthophagus taurus]
MEMDGNNRIAYWMSDKKLQKINRKEFQKSCLKYNFEIYELDLNKSLDSQGPFAVFLHKLTDIIALEVQNDPKSKLLIKKIEDYIEKHPNLIVIDPIPKVRQLLSRYNSYSIIKSTNLSKYGIFTPNFCEITINDADKVTKQLKNSEVTYPFICKPILGHGSKQAHLMSIIFNEDHLADCRIPCVAQSFVNHNAVLYKVFVVGSKFHIVERPSLKNFYESDRETVYFDSCDISSAKAQSCLSILDPEDENVIRREPNLLIIQKMAEIVRKNFEMDLLGIDVVIENTTGRYAIIDVNAYPGYDGFPNFFDVLLECISSKIL